MWSAAYVCQPSWAVMGARDLPPALRWSIAITRKLPANSVVGFTGAEGPFHTSMIDCRPAGANVRIGKPRPNSS
jgi:hypothetical protein